MCHPPVEINDGNSAAGAERAAKNLVDDGGTPRKKPRVSRWVPTAKEVMMLERVYAMDKIPDRNT